MIRSTTDEMLAARFDPEPWLNRAGEHDSLQPGEKRPNGWVYLPRPEFIPSRFTTRALGQLWEVPRSEPNPILVAFRGRAQINSTGEDAAEWIERVSETFGATPAQVEEAHRVLTRFVAVTR